MKKYLIILLALATACTKDPEVSSPAPHVEILAHTELLRTSVTLNCKLDGGNLSSIKEFCFKIGNNSSLKDAQIYPLSEIVVGEHALTVKNLDIGGTYFYAVCISNGLNTITSEVRALTTQTTSPPLVGELSLQTNAGITASASVEENGGGQIETCGFCWKISPQPTIFDQNMRTTLQQDNSFSGVLRELAAGQNYYVRAFVQNTSGISYSNEVYVSTSPEPGESVVPIPDAAFKAYLVENFDKDGDGEISIKEAAEVRTIEVQTTQIESLSGISYFTGLTSLRATGSRADQTRALAPVTGKLSQLDLTKNTELLHLYLENNLIGVLDLQANTKLVTLSIYNNPVARLDLRANPALQSLDCWNCILLQSLDLRNCTSLTSLFAADCNLTETGILDLSSCTKLTRLDVTNNPALRTIKMWPGFDAASNVQFRKDDTASYTASESPEFPDPNFWDFVLQYDTDRDGKVSFAEAAAVTTMNVSGQNIGSLEGIERFVNITELNCNGTWSNPKLQTLDVSKNTKLRTLDCSDNQLSRLDAGNNTNLHTLDCSNNQLSYLNINKGLEVLHANSNQLTTLQIAHCTDLTRLFIFNNGLTELDVSKNVKLERFICYENALTSLDITQNTNLKTLECQNNQLSYLNIHKELETLDANNNQLTTLQLAHCTNLTVLELQNNKLTELDITKNAKLEEFTCSHNSLSSLDVTHNMLLRRLDCTDNPLNQLDVSKNPELQMLYCPHNGLSNLDVTSNLKLSDLQAGPGNRFETIDVSKNLELTILYLNITGLSGRFDISNNTKLRQFQVMYNPNLKIIYVWNGFNAANYPAFSKDATAEYVVKGASADIIDIPDANFKAYLIQNFDTNRDGQISQSEAAVVTGKIEINTDNITSLQGIEWFVNLEELVCKGNGNAVTGSLGKLQTLDVSRNTKLTILNCRFNKLISLDVSKNTNLTILDCIYNQLSSLDVSKNTKLTDLACMRNELSSLDVSKNANLTRLECTSTQLTHLDVSKNANLTYLLCGTNKLSSLDVSKNAKLTALNCSINGLSSLDVTNNLKLRSLQASRNNFGTIDISKNLELTNLYLQSTGLSGSFDISSHTKLTTFEIDSNPNLKTIYVWSGFNTANYPEFKKDATAEYVVKSR